MSNTFDTGRFWRYFKWDLRNAYNNVVLALLICGSVLAIVFVTTELFSFIFTGQSVWLSSGEKIAAIVFGALVSTMFLPSKAYGRLTEKRYGSDWLMMPASSFEKTVSMVVTVGVVMPLCFFAIQIFWDLLLGLAFPSSYGDSLLTGRIPLNLYLMAFLGNMDGALIFTLGSICFRKSKVGKTFLTCFIVTVAVTSIISLIAAHNSDMFARFSFVCADFDDLHEMLSSLAAITYTFDALVAVALIVATYCRVRTIKH